MTSRRHSRVWLVASFAIVALATLASSGAGAADPGPGGQGTDTATPPTE